MKRRISFLEYLKRNPIMVSFCLSTGIVVSCLVFYSRYFNGPISTDIDDWAGFATFCGFSLSLISIIFIFMTYRSQQELSSILQFESSFFNGLRCIILYIMSARRILKNIMMRLFLSLFQIQMI